MDEALGNPEPDSGAMWAVLWRAGVPAAAVDLAGIVRAANPAFGLACGRSVAELVDAPLAGLALADDHPALEGVLALLAGADDEVADLALRTVGTDGDVRLLELHLGRLGTVGRAGSSASLLCVARDLTDERRRERSDRRTRVESARRETTDPGSGLPNRRGLELLLGSAGRRSARDGSTFAVLHCLLSLEDGHPGDVDAVVVDCLERLRRRLRSADSITRTGDDVLVVVAEDLHDEQDAAGVAYRLLSSVVERAGEGGDQPVDMRVGIAVADATTPADTLPSIAAEAAGTAEPGGFRIVDRRDTRSP